MCLQKYALLTFTECVDTWYPQLQGKHPNSVGGVLWTELCTLKPQVEALILGRWGHWEVMTLRWGHETRPWNGTAAWAGRDPRKPGLSLSSPREKEAVCKPGRESSPDLDPAGPLTLDFQPLELWANASLRCKRPVYGVLSHRLRWLKTGRNRGTLPGHSLCLSWRVSVSMSS